MGVDFGHLACCASFDIFGDEGFQVGPPVVRGDQLECLGNPGMPGSHVVVKKGNYSPPKSIVCHNN